MMPHLTGSDRKEKQCMIVTEKLLQDLLQELGFEP